MGFSDNVIAAWLKVYDGARFRSEMDRAAASEQRVAAGARSIAASMAAASTRARSAMASVGAFGKRMAMFGRSWTTHVSLPLLAIGVIAGHMAVDFDSAMARVQTQAGGSAREVRVLRGEVLDLAKTLPQSPQELAEGLYHLESIGLRGARAIYALRIAAEGAAIGNANLEATASALGGAWLTNIKGAGDLRHVMALLNATVGAGNIRMEDLVLALGTGVLPAAKVAGLGIHDVVSALAVFTDENMQGSSAMAQFSTALHFLYAPTAKAAKALNSIGLETSQLAKDMHKPRGLLVALTDLHEHLRGLSKIEQETKLGEILPGGRGRVLLVLLNQLERLDSKYRQISRTSGNFGRALARTRQTPQYRLRTAVSSLEASGIELGAALLPAAVPLFERFVGIVTRISDAFQKLSPGQRQFVLGLAAVAVVAGPVITVLGMMLQGIAAIGGALVTLGTFLLTNPIGLVILAVAAFIILYKKVRWFRDAVNATWKAIKAGTDWLIHAVGDAFKWLGGAIGAVFDWIKGHWKLLLLVIGGPILFAAVMTVVHFWGKIKSAAGAAWNFIKDHWKTILSIMFPMIVPPVLFIIRHFDQIKTAFHDAVSGLAHIFKAAFEGVKGAVIAAVEWIIDQVEKVIDAYNAAAGSIPILGGDLTVPGIRDRITTSAENGTGIAPPSALTNPGVLSPFPQPKKLRRSGKAKTSSVKPIRLGHALAGAGVGAIEVPVHLNGREIARAMGRVTADDKARRTG